MATSTVPIDPEYEKRVYNHMDILVAEMQRIYDKYGELTPSIVVKEARKKKSILHPYFTWDASEALEKHLLHEARMLMNRIDVVIVEKGAEPEDSTMRVRFLHNVRDPDTGTRSYQLLPTVMRDENMRGIVTNQIRDQLRSMRVKYAIWKDILQEELTSALDVIVKGEGGEYYIVGEFGEEEPLLQENAITSE